MFDFAGGEVKQDLTLAHELTVSGVVTRDGQPAAGALVALSEALGTQVGATHCDDVGHYAFQLPPTGRYVFTAYDPETGSAHARKVMLTIESEVVDIDIPVEATQLAK